MPLFGDMTSNSIIVLNELLSQEGERRRELISDSVRTAKSLLDGTLDAGEFRERLALERGGIYGAESDEQRLEQLVVDVAVSLGCRQSTRASTDLLSMMMHRRSR